MPTWVAIWIAVIMTALMFLFAIYLNWRMTEIRNWKRWIEWDTKHRMLLARHQGEDV